MTAVSSLFLGAAAVAVMPAAGSAQQAPAPQYTAAQAETGQEVSEETCAACHKPDLTGGDQAPPLSGAYFASSWGGHPVAELLTFAKDNMPFTQPSSLDVETYVNVVSYILSFNGVPAGDTPLAMGAPGVITIVAKD